MDRGHILILNQLKNSLNRNNVSVTIKLLITVLSFSKYQSIALTRIMLKIEVHTQRVDMYQQLTENKSYIS